MRKNKILLLDDDVGVSCVVGDLLRISFGGEYIVTTTVDRALEVLHREKVSLVISERYVGGRSTLPLVQKIAEERWNASFIFFTDVGVNVQPFQEQGQKVILVFKPSISVFLERIGTLMGWPLPSTVKRHSD